MPYIQGKNLVITGHDRVYGRTNDGYGGTQTSAYIPNETDSLSNDDWNANTSVLDPGFYIDPPSLNSSYGRFGKRVAVGDGVIAIGQTEYDNPLYSGSPTFATHHGRLHLYDYEGNLIKSIDNPDAAGSNDSYWPQALAIAGGRIFAGAGRIFNNSVMTNALDEGAVYIFSLSGELLKTIYAPISADATEIISSRFGEFLAAGDGRLVITAYNANGGSNYSDGKGSMFIYDYDGNFIRRVDSINDAFYDRFGYSPAVGSGRIVVANHPQAQATTRDIHIFDLDGNLVKKVSGWGGFNTTAIGDGRIVVGSQDGLAKILDLGGSTWIYQKHIATGGQSYNTNDLRDANNIPSGILNATSDLFGSDVAVGNGRVWVGAQNNDTSSNGASTGVTDLGAVYEFTDYGKFIAKHVPTDGQGGRVDAELGGFRSIACAPGIVAFGASGYSSDTGRVYVYRGVDNLPWGSTTHMLNVFDR